ncbi:shikimate dehydrogenase [Corynebacterium yudongzhengii]|uniref:Shikimate dehydrogenase n=1 Tax=Corynebacterium yudongzhengii TaxID=2080740 RepID=A0A2U1T7L6_9CORY|nr:shikimate dehydrogenase [Corynebacterium yudongzhengii]AWB81818.1 shikimate dehydrogenase [Corynebacterium yudongzhengii]PWC01994.1 shikimate dehydrogenase [Corynebacterium yudongzhengii]
MTITHRAAVLGNPVEHSRSPIMHNAGYAALGLNDWEYTRITTDAEDVARIVGEADESYAGFSVTMPGKFAALEVADSLSERAELIGAANTLVRTGAGWHADNTDCVGVLGALGELFDGATVAAAVLLGSGGTARPALWALAKIGVSEVTVVNRSDRSEALADLVDAVGLEVTFSTYDTDLQALTRQADVVVSTVPSAALDGREQALGHAPVLDVIYDPWPTPLTTQAAANGYSTVGGHVMLAHQAYPQFEAFTGHSAPRPQMWDALVNSLR